MVQCLLFGGCLQPATHGSLVGQVVGREASFQVALLSRNDHQRHQRYRWHEGHEQPETVDPACDTELEQRESQVDGIATVAIRAGAHDRGRGTIATNGCASSLKLVHSRDEQHHGDQHRSGPEWPAYGTSYEP